MSDTSLFDSEDEILQLCCDLDDCDIIEATPQKLKQKSVVKTSTLKNCLEKVAHEFCVVRNVAKVEQDLEFLTVEYKNPHVFYEIKELLSFDVYDRSSDLSIKLIGFYGQSSPKVHYLQEFYSSSNSIELNLELIVSFPIVNSKIEVYGFVKYQKEKIIFVVRFWFNLSCDIKTYLRCLLNQRAYVPNCYTRTVNKLENFNLTELYASCNEDSLNYLFDEIDESTLYKNVVFIENVNLEIEQIMNISDDIFK